MDNKGHSFTCNEPRNEAEKKEREKAFKEGLIVKSERYTDGVKHIVYDVNTDVAIQKYNSGEELNSFEKMCVIIGASDLEDFDRLYEIAGDDEILIKLIDNIKETFKDKDFILEIYSSALEELMTLRELKKKIDNDVEEIPKRKALIKLETTRRLLRAGLSFDEVKLAMGISDTEAKVISEILNKVKKDEETKEA